MATFTQEIQSTRNEGYLWPGDYWNWNYDDLYVGYPGTFGHESMSLRFVNVTIPQGATITSAKISLKCWYATSTNIYTKIYGMDEDSTAQFPTEDYPSDIPTQRTKTTASVDWDRAGGMPEEQYVDTSDITSIVQEIVDRGGWSSGNSMGFIFDDDGMALYATQIFYAWQRWNGTYASGKYPVLTIEYETAGQIEVDKDLKYTVTSTKQAKEKSLRYYIAGNYGLKISKTGNDVKFSTPFEDVFTSGRGVLGKRSFDSITLSTADGGIINDGESHTIGYAPIALVTVTCYDGTKINVPGSHESTWNDDEVLEETFDYYIGDGYIGFTAYVHHYEIVQGGTDTPLDNQNYTFDIIYLFNEISSEV